MILIGRAVRWDNDYKDEIRYFQKTTVELVLELAHIDNYDHLQQIINIKYPKCLHIADKHFSVKYEHLPIGKGDLDFQRIFSKYLTHFEGRIILEITEDDVTVADSKDKIREALLTIK
jgi:sugar phosphate isomerase/epimerase